MDYDCSHISEVVQDLDVEEMRSTLKNRSCNVCLRIDELWICMKCRQILCGRYAAGHSMAHFEYHSNHCITLNIESATLFCYKCDEYVEPKCHDDELNRLRQFVLYTQKPSKCKDIKRRGSANRQNGKKKKTTNRRGPRTNKKPGITNEGNNCFMNAVWQSLSNINLFIFCIKHLLAVNNINTNLKDTRNGMITDELRTTLVSLSEWTPPSGSKMGDPISARALYSIICKLVPRYRGFHQHDAHEFLIHILDKLHSELKQLLEADQEITNSEEPTIVSFVFGGMLLSEVCCLVCGFYSKAHDPFLDISLDIPDYDDTNNSEERPVDTLNDCLERFIKVEELTEGNYYYCKGCNVKQKSTKKFWISRLPNVLCLHLKRFRYVNNQRIKVHTPIKFPISSLDMSRFFLKDKDISVVKKEDCLYDLSSVIVHEGNGGGSGHYTSYALTKGEWFECNDEKIYEVDSSVVENVEAYILFYSKR
ncbi:ubiquitin carboxyl-terminal hydrolase 3-like [Adelges cooleyi]|uniref:ubiquitin carboxyl-terminal hydrolase 3-like n=1 Tax=Adelges cooleyi TaxID=133065 RepID=UPI0021804BB3|nr:ubiquitin carboxyl-terminal hydrolase 3-like [Adelges cooleyi]